jgi:hypothetical protein
MTRPFVKHAPKPVDSSNRQMLAVAPSPFPWALSAKDRQAQVAKINGRNAKFWKIRSKVMNQALSIRAVRESVFANLNSQLEERALKEVQSIEKISGDALQQWKKSRTTQPLSRPGNVTESEHLAFRTAVSTKGGAQQKRDRLYRLLIYLRDQDPNLTQRKALVQLKNLAGQSIALINNRGKTLLSFSKDGQVFIKSVDVNSGRLVFLDDFGRARDVSSIKDRLYRAKIEIYSR